jgi:hypothetical protein
MAGEVKLPVLGSVKTSYVVAGVLITGGIVGYAYLRRKSAAAAGSTGTTAAADNTATAAIDPETGYPQGSPEDEAALEQLQGAGYAGGDDGTGDYYGYYPPVSTQQSNTGPGTFTDNAYWLQYCEQVVTGYSASQIQSALSAYLAGAKLTTAQYSIYQAAIGVAGPPPSPPATPIAPTQPSGTGGNTGPTGLVSGLSVKNTSASSLELDWAGADGATGYKITVLDGSKTVESETVKGTSATVSGLKAKTRYQIEVQAQPGTQHSDTYATTS